MALARRDPGHVLLDSILEKRDRGADLRFVAGYLAQVREAKGDTWADDLLEELLARRPDDSAFFLELTWRMPTTARSAARILDAAKANVLEPRLAVQLAFGGWSNTVPAPLFLDLLAALSRTSRYVEAALELVHFRVSAHPEEWDSLRPIVLELLQKPALVKARGMNEHYWLELSQKVAAENARLISRTLLAAHGEKDEETWFLEHSQTRPVLDACIDADPQAVWEELRPYLEEPGKAVLFITGFPDDVIGRLPHDAIMAWIAESPDRRAPFIARLVAHDLGDGGLGAKLLTAYRSVVSSTMMSAWATGAWWGEASTHWDQVADVLLHIAETSTEREVRTWATGTARRFRKEAEQERKREAEERVRRGR
jgi:hypothetical protein